MKNEPDSMEGKPGARDGDRIKSPTHPLDPTLVFARRYQAFFNSTNDAIAIINPNHEILDANPQLLKLCGYPYDKIVSMSLNDIFDKACHEEIQTRLRIMMEGRQRKNPIECDILTQTGKQRIVEINLSLLRDQYGYPKTFLAVMHDITRRKEAEKRHLERAEETQKVFDTVHTILIVCDVKKRIRRINRSGLEALGKTESEALGRKIGDSLGCRNRHNTTRGCGNGAHARKCMLNGGVTRCLTNNVTVLDSEVSIIRENQGDDPFYFRMNIVPFETKGERWCVVSLEDITVRKNAEIEAMRLHESITRANLELKKTLENLAKSQSQLLEAQKLEQVGLLASGLAHNLKTPLGGIKGYAQLLKLDYETMHELDMIINEVEIMESIINNLMLKSRKGHKTQIEIVNLNDLLNIELEFLAANMFYKHRVTSTIELDENLPSITGVYAHFSQPIMNIIQNALDAMYDAPERALTIRTRHDKTYIYVDVSDTGCGIPEDIRSEIFEVFYTSKPASNERQGNEPHGTGLGLSSAIYFIHKYDGKIEIESKVGEGTTVTIKIPYRELEKTRSPYRVLVVDDSESMVDILIQICQHMGLEAYGANDGKRALKLYDQVKPHVIVSDLCMPGLSGPELVSKIRKINPSQRIIYISGYTENPEYRDWLAQEANQSSPIEVIKKPFPLGDFKKVLEKMIMS